MSKTIPTTTRHKVHHALSMSKKALELENKLLNNGYSHKDLPPLCEDIPWVRTEVLDKLKEVKSFSGNKATFDDQVDLLDFYAEDLAEISFANVQALSDIPLDTTTVRTATGFDAFMHKIRQWASMPALKDRTPDKRYTFMVR